MEGLSNFLRIEEVVEPPPEIRRMAALQDYEGVYRRSRDDPEKFWAEVAGELVWYEPWQKVLDWQMPAHRWFVGARVNITANALDRHISSWRKNKIAFIWLGEEGQERAVSYWQLYRLVNELAHGLRRQGVGCGDKVVIYMPLTLEAVATMLACARIGAVHSVVYAGLGAGALRDRILDCRARVVITADVTYRRGRAIDLASIAEDALAGLDFVERRVIWHREAPGKEAKGRWIPFEALLGEKGVCPPEPMDAEDPLFILYTSGTTGKPKGVVHVHGGYMVGTYYLIKNFFDLKDHDVFWCTSDIGWIVGHSYIVYAPLVAGITTVFREGALDHPDPGMPWRIVEKYGVSVIFTAPTAIRSLMKHGSEWPRGYNLESLRLVTCAGEPLNPEAWRWAYENLVADHGGYVLDNWWQTEIAGPTLGTLPAMPARPGKVGKALPGVTADVVDRQGKAVPPNQGGFLVLGNPLPHMMRTVYGDDARYAEAWGIIPGRYFTGDVAVKDEDGYFTVLGRADDVLNIAGHRIGTMEVESALVSHPAVAEAAVIGKPDPVKWEVVKAFVILKVGHHGTQELARELQDHVRGQLGPIVIIGEIEFVDRLPKTRSGKIMRRLLKARELGVDPGDVTTLED